MFRPVNILYFQKFVGFEPFKRRPTGLSKRSDPAYYTPHYKSNRDPEEVVRTSPLKHTIFKKCKECGRCQAFSIKYKSEFHTCCGTREMSYIGNMADAISRPGKIRKNMRIWDFENDRPKSNPHKPRPKGRCN
eukprot:Tbor_TRINITY_DN2346_c0_g1::TRINITY_DN2346_c0_g1_i1::g.200::m.200